MPDEYDSAADARISYDAALEAKRLRGDTHWPAPIAGTRIELPAPVPLAACFTNVPRRGRVPTKRYLEWQREAMWTIKAQRSRPVKGRVAITVSLVPPDNRARDAGNTDKAVMDVLVKAGIIEDDSNRYVRRVTYEWVDAGPPCVVVISRFDEVAK